MRRGLRGLVAGVALLALTPPTVEACDSTVCLMLTRGAAGQLERGSFQFDLSFRHSDLSARRLGTGSTNSVVRPKVLLEEGRLVPGYHEDLDGGESFVQLDMAWAATSRTVVFGSLPVFGQRYADVGHGGLQTAYNVRGLGDLVLGVRRTETGEERRTAQAAPHGN